MKLAVRIIAGLAATGILTLLLLLYTGTDILPGRQPAAWIMQTFGIAGEDTALLSKQHDLQDEMEALAEEAAEQVLRAQNNSEMELSEKDLNAEAELGKSGAKAGSENSEAKAGSEKSEAKAGSENSEAGTGSEKSGAETGNEKQPYTYRSVTDSYFEDALFIGDSRTVGMKECGLMEHGTYYAKTGIGIGAILKEAIVSENGTMISVETALQRHAGEFGKVYIMIGINDMQKGDSSWFTGQYEELLAAVKSTQPDAVIFIQGNIPMSASMQDFSGAVNNANLQERNEASRLLADEEQIFYLEIDKIYADENGNLKSSYTSDGLHVYLSDYEKWISYLKCHAIVR